MIYCLVQTINCITRGGSFFRYFQKLLFQGLGIMNLAQLEMTIDKGCPDIIYQ